MLRVNNIKIDIKDDISLVRKKLVKKLRIKDSDINYYSIYKESIDARKRDTISFVYSVDVRLKNEKQVLKSSVKDVVEIQTNVYHDIDSGNMKLEHRPVIIGFGPAGIFAALILAQRGYRPIVFERGFDVDKRTLDIENFWKTGEFNPSSNVQFGEGGAGTFSDGKLTTRIKDIRCEKVLREFVNFGAPKEILYSHKPHVGTDILKDVIKNIREEIIRLGGSVNFGCNVTDFDIKDGKIKGIRINGDEYHSTSHVIMAIGHSARDTYRCLYNRNVHMQQKPFAIGVRIEHPQKMIDKAQYKEFAGNKKLGAADYRLTAKTSKGRSVYTFCMCPGGTVIASASTPGQLVTNGMSEHARDMENANSGLLVNVETSDFESESPLAGIEFQEKYEALAYKTGGEDYKAPCQLVGDFLKDRKSTAIGSVKPSYRPGVTMSDMRECLPDFVTEALKEGIVEMDKKLKGFAMDDAVMTGVETRSSAPVRINRDNETLQSISVENLFPCGEGAGYAGGIVTAAVDGIKCAEMIISSYEPLSKV